MATDPFGGTDQLAGTKRLMALEALRRAGKPNPSLAGALLQGLSAGLMGLYEGQDERASQAAQSKAIDALYGGSPPVAPMGNVDVPSPHAETPNPLASALGQKTLGLDDGSTIPAPPQNPLAGLNPEFRDRFPALRTAAAERGVTFNAPEPGSIGSLRSQGQQDALFAQGRSAPGPIVTGTRNSNHILGQALDVVPTEGTTPRQIGSTVSELIKGDPRFAGMRSGATFSNLYDPLHVELNKPNTQLAYNASGFPAPSANPLAGLPPAAPPQQQPPVQVAQAQGIPQDQSAQRLYQLYQSAGNPREKQIYGHMLMQQVQKQRDMQLQLQLDAQKKMNPAYGDIPANAGAKAGAEETAKGRARIAPDIIAGEASLAGAKTRAEAKAKTEVQQAAALEGAKKNSPAVSGLVRDAIKATDAMGSTGLVGQMTSGIDSSPAGRLESHLIGIRARIGFEELNKMRASSPTGGALGPVSDAENKLLQSVYGSITVGLPADVLKARLRKLDALYNATIHQPGDLPKIYAMPESAFSKIQPGETEGGYEYLGGDRADPKSWRKAQ